MSSFHFYRWNQLSHSFGVYAPYKKPPHIFGDVRYWVNQVRCCAAWLTDVEEKQA